MKKPAEPFMVYKSLLFVGIKVLKRIKIVREPQITALTLAIPLSVTNGKGQDRLLYVAILVQQSV